MACISPDGKPTESGIRTLRALKSGQRSPEEVAQETGQPVFKVRSGLRELSQAGLVSQKDDKYELSSEGAKLLDTISS